MLQKHCRGQNDIRIPRGIGHELLVDANEQVIPGKSSAHLLLMRGDGERIGVLNQHGFYRRSALERVRFASQNCADARLVKTTNAGIAKVQTLDHRFVQFVDPAVAMKCAAPLMRPCACDGRNAQSRMHVGRAVALA